MLIVVFAVVDSVIHDRSVRLGTVVTTIVVLGLVVIGLVFYLRWK